MFFNFDIEECLQHRCRVMSQAIDRGYLVPHGGRRLCTSLVFAMLLEHHCDLYGLQRLSVNFADYSAASRVLESLLEDRPAIYLVQEPWGYKAWISNEFKRQNADGIFNISSLNSIERLDVMRIFDYYNDRRDQEEGAADFLGGCKVVAHKYIEDEFVPPPQLRYTTSSSGRLSLAAIDATINWMSQRHFPQRTSLPISWEVYNGTSTTA